MLRLISKQGLLKHNTRKKYHSGKNYRLQNNLRTLVKIDKASMGGGESIDIIGLELCGPCGREGVDPLVFAVNYVP